MRGGEREREGGRKPQKRKAERHAAAEIGWRRRRRNELKSRIESDVGFDRVTPVWCGEDFIYKGPYLELKFDDFRS